MPTVMRLTVAFRNFANAPKKLKNQALLEITRYKYQFRFSLTEQSTEH